MTRKTSSKILILTLLVVFAVFAVFGIIANGSLTPPLSDQQKATLDKLTTGEDWAEYNEQWVPEKSKAVILIHGLMDGALYEPSAEDGTLNRNALYAFGNIDMSGGMDDLGGMMGGDGLGIISNMLSMLTSDEECFPKTKVRIGNMEDDSPFSASGMWSDVFEYFQGRLGDEYDVLCWQYDWRQHLDNAAYHLDKFINECGYESVIIAGHSMGTCVTSRYLAMGEAQRNKVELFIPFGGPMLGSIDASEFLFFNDINADMDEGGMMSVMSSLIALIDEDKAIVGSFTTLYHLMVSAAFNQTPYFENGETCYKLDGEYITTDQLIDFISDFAWAKGYYDEDLGYADVKVIIKTLSEFQQKVFVDGKHISTLVNTHYIVGTGLNTTVAMSIDKYGFQNGRKTSLLGDGIVPAYSASAGLPLDSENVYLMEGANHIEIVSAAAGAFDVLDEILSACGYLAE